MGATTYILIVAASRDTPFDIVVRDDDDIRQGTGSSDRQNHDCESQVTAGEGFP